MVDSVIQLSQDGTGKAVYMSKVNVPIGGVSTDVYIPITADVGLWSYQAVANNSACAASKNHLVLFNATGSNIKIRVQEVFAYPYLTAAVVGANCTLQVLGIGQAGTGGTAGTIRKHNSDNPSLPAQITASTNVTTLTIPSNTEYGGGSVFVEEASAAATGAGRSILFQKTGNVQPLVLNEGEGIVVRQTAFAGIGAVSVHIAFTYD